MMLTKISVGFGAEKGISFFAGSGALPLPAGYWEGILAPVVVLAVVVMAIGFLFLVGRLSWAAREFVAATRERQRTHRKLVEVIAERVENEGLGVDQLWSASAALSAC